MLSFYQNATAQAELNLTSNLQCGTYTYCVDVTVKATNGNFQLGTSSVLLNYNTAALTFQSYTPMEFDTLGSCSNTWSPQQIDVDTETGEFSLTMKLLNPSSNCTTIDTATKVIGTLCFSIEQQGASPDILFDVSQTKLNRNIPDNGTNAITINNFGGIITAGELACDCSGIGTACNDNNVFTTNDEYDINCDCIGQILDEDNDGIADGVDPCQEVHYEAEDAYYVGPGLRTNHIQFFGDGFLDYYGWNGDSILFTVTAIDTGNHDVKIRYANGGTSTRYLRLVIDGVLITDTLAFPNDTSWGIWNEVNIPQNFTIGTHTILLETFQNHGPNIDRLTVSYCTGCSTAGQLCDDGDSCTILDIMDVNCNCAGVLLDSDNDGICDQADICANADDNIDTDNDGTPDGCDACNDNLIGTVCDDGNPCTINDLIDANCNCNGTPNGIDTDNDGVCDAFDVCVGGDDNLDMDLDGLPDFCDSCDNRTIGMPCDDGNPCTVLDVYNSTCGCGGIPIYVDISAAITDVSCYGFGNGEISLSVAGAFGELQYEWNTNDSTSNLQNLIPGDYKVTVTDFRNCKDSSNYIIVQPDSLIVPYSIVASADSNGSIDLMPTGGISPYTFTWENGDSTEDINNLIPYTYDVIITDSNNCIQNMAIDVYPADMCVDTIMQAEDGVLHLMGFDIWNERWALGDGFIYLKDDSTETATYDIDIPTDGFYTIGFRYTDKWATRTAKIIVDGVTEFEQFEFPRTYDWANWQKREFVQYFTTGTHQLVVAHANHNWGPWIDFISVCNQVVVPISLDAAITNNICYADSAGALTVLPTGGTRNYTYLWSTGDTTKTITNLLSGDYYITVTDEVGQTATDTFTIDQPTEITPVHVIRNVKCKGQTNGRSNMTVTGGTSGYSYQWSNGQTWKTTGNVVAGTYTLTITDANGCIDISNAIIGEPDTMDAIFNNTVSTGNDGTIDLTPLGGNPPYTFYWKDSTLTEDRMNLPVGNYRITITDTLGCQLKTSTSIYPAGLCLDTIMEAEEGIYQNVNYHIWYPDSATGRGYIHFNADTSGTANYTFTVPQDGYYGIGFRYSNQYNTGRTLKIEVDNIVEYTDFVFPSTVIWKNYEFIDFNKYLTAGTHTLTLKQRQNWSPRIDFITICDLQLEPLVTQTNITCHGDSTGVISVTMDGGREPYQYIWNTGETTASIQNLPVGTYWVSVTDTLNQSFIDTIDIIQPLPITPIVTNTNIDCNGNANGQATVNVSGGNGNYTYNWSNNATTNSLANLNVGTYDLTVTDNTGCMANVTTTITEPTALVANIGTIINANCNGGNGSATLSPTGGTAPYTYLWANGQTTNTAILSAGTYTPTVTDANGCTAMVTFTVTEPTNLSTTITNSQNLNCNGNNSGQINTSTTGGTGGYTYLWNNGQTTANLQNIGAGNYTLTTTDINGCSFVVSQTITEPTVLANQITATNVDCNGNNNATIAMSTTGGNSNYTYLWSSGQTASGLTNLYAGVYLVTITDNMGCVVMDSVTITEPSILSTNLVTLTNVDCNGNNNGNATINAVGGAGNYTYSWNNGSMTTTANNLIAGNYIASVTDNNGCLDTILVTITEPTVLNVAIDSSQNVDCFGNNSGQINTTTTGGTTGYSYLWNSGQTTANLQNVIAGTYTLTVTDANNCNSVINETLTQPFVLTPQTTITNIDCNGSDNGNIVVSTAGGTGTYTYLWNNGQAISNISNLQTGMYIVTITDSLNCSTTDTATIIEPSALTVSHILTPTTGANGSIDLTVSGGSPTYTFNWSDGSIVEDRNDLTVGNHYVTITDANGCSIMERFTIFDANTCIDDIYQAEMATVNGTNIILSDSTGALGNGYTDFGTNTAETVTFNVTPTIDTMYQFSIRYTQGTDDKALAISIDGNLIHPSLTFSKTTDWNTWDYVLFDYNLTSGSHTVELKNIGSNGPNIDYLSLCSTPDTTTSTIDINDTKTPIGLETYPNPVKNLLNIDIELSNIKEGTLTIIDVNGRVKYQEIINNNGMEMIQKQINVEDYASGVYFVQLKTENGTVMKKITVLNH